MTPSEAKLWNLIFSIHVTIYFCIGPALRIHKSRFGFVNRLLRRAFNAWDAHGTSLRSKFRWALVIVHWNLVLEDILRAETREYQEKDVLVFVRVGCCELLYFEWVLSFVGALGAF